MGFFFPLALNFATEKPGAQQQLSHFTAQTLTIYLLNLRFWGQDLHIFSMFRKCLVGATVQIKTLKRKVNKQRCVRNPDPLCISVLET